MTNEQRMEYCKDCDRSVYSQNPSCDINIENNGKYVMAGDNCGCKVVKSYRNNAILQKDTIKTYRQKL